MRFEWYWRGLKVLAPPAWCYVGWTNAGKSLFEQQYYVAGCGSATNPPPSDHTEVVAVHAAECNEQNGIAVIRTIAGRHPGLLQCLNAEKNNGKATTDGFVYFAFSVAD
eukprot:TRINITY_DN7871_c0_g1_i1.p1 TRINITY_DN7871_c0_g1~~TRINITY_DN7871_c0_g1_i1.p1  ORF type:complete len:109 (+),score=7.96 TRINITY_DN7871_c0_g1_i1:206-532(+)